MGGGNQCKSKMKRERNAEKAKGTKAKSQLKDNAKSMTIVCKICKVYILYIICKNFNF